jgi:hypothetical protein
MLIFLAMDFRGVDSCDLSGRDVVINKLRWSRCPPLAMPNLLTVTKVPLWPPSRLGLFFVHTENGLQGPRL